MKQPNARDTAFADCAKRHRGILLGIARGFVGGDERDDLLQEMLLALWHALPTFQARAAESTFVYRVALNTALAWSRRRPPQLRAIDEADEPIAADSGPPELLLDAERSDALLAAIARLATLDRALVLLHLDGLSYRGIGEVLGLSETNVGARLSRARRQLSTLLLRSQT